MAKTFEDIDEKLAGWIGAQKLFFVATSPGRHEGHVNLSPKGVDGTFSIIDHRTVAYLDIIGSGIETVAHLRNDGRERAHRGDAVLLRRAAANPAPARPR